MIMNNEKNSTNESVTITITQKTDGITLTVPEITFNTELADTENTSSAVSVTVESTEKSEIKKTKKDEKAEKTEKSEKNEKTETGETVSVSTPPTVGKAINSKYVYLFVIVLLLAVIAVLALKIKKGKKEENGSDSYGDTFQPEAEAPSPCAASGLNVAKVHDIGRRKGQQDSFGLSDTDNTALVNSKGVLTVVADGMGGLAGGDEVSSRIVIDMITGFTTKPAGTSPNEELTALMNTAVTDVNDYLTRTIGLKKGGSTLISGIIKENRLYWISVGDSRISLFRNGRLTDLNKKHNWGAELDKKVARGEMTAQQAAADVHRAELTSYIGMGNLRYVDRSAEPVILQPNDKIIFMTDGIFNTLSDSELETLLSQEFSTVSEAINSAVINKNSAHQDNYTAVILEYK